MKAAINNQTIKRLEPQDKVYEVRDLELKGFILRVETGGTMTYFCEYARGKRKKLGCHPALTPALAREKAKKVHATKLMGGDPSQEETETKTSTYLEFIEKEYKPWLVANLRTGEATFDRLKISFDEFHTLKLDEINAMVMEKWRSRRLNDGVKATTINRELADLRACFNRAVEWGVLKVPPLEKVKLCKVDSSPKVRFLSQEEEKSLRKSLDKRDIDIREARKRGNQWREERNEPLYPDLENVAYADYLKPAVILSLNTGVRRGELFGLKWSDVDFSQRVLTVTAETAKSGKTRHIPLNTEAMAVLKGWREQSPESAVYVFEGQHGKPFHDVRKSWAGVLEGSGIKDFKPITGFRWHDLRHSFASKLVMAGVDLNTVRELLGHSDYKMTLRYSHLAPEHKMAAVQKLEWA